MWGVWLAFVIQSIPATFAFTCEQSSEENGCSYQVCLVEGDSNYPRPSLVILPLTSRKSSIPLRIHFHGWTQERDGSPRNPDYDFSWTIPGASPDLALVQKYWTSFGLVQAACSIHPEVVLSPLSRGHDDDYESYFSGPLEFTRYLKGVMDRIPLPVDGVPEIHLSAHSGGGKTLLRILSLDDGRVSRIKLLDATYSSEGVQKANAWLSRKHEVVRVLQAYSVTRETRAFARSLQVNGVSTSSGGISITRSPLASLKVQIIEDGSLDHYEVVPGFFSDDGWSLK